jgi:SNF2 family DNA or RNA helicase
MLSDLKDKTKESKVNMADVGALLNYLIQICDTTETMDPEIRESGKIEVLKEIVSEEIARRHKVVLFSFFGNKVVPIIVRELSKFGKCYKITGKTKPEEAEKIKKRFKRSEEARFLVCSDAMAYGANLQEARYVINFDLPWNPARIDQRIRRVYRRGQEHTVTVISLVTDNTVEDKILEKLTFKRRIFDQFLGVKKTEKGFSLSELLELIK